MAANPTVAVGVTEPPAAPPPPYELVDGDQIVVASDALTQEASLRQVLHWIGFTVEANRDNLQTQSLGVD